MIIVICQAYIDNVVHVNYWLSWKFRKFQKSFYSILRNSFSICTGSFDVTSFSVEKSSTNACGIANLAKIMQDWFIYLNDIVPVVHLLLVIISNKSSFDKPKFYLQQNSTNVHISEWCNIEISFKFRYYVIKYTVNCHFFYISNIP